MAADIDQPGKFEAHLRSCRRGRDGQHIDVADRHDDGLRGHGQARGPDRHAARRAQVDLPGRREARGDRGLLPAGRKGSSLLVKTTGKTKPGKYAIALLCEDKHNQPDSVDVKTVRIYKVLGAFQQTDQPGLPSAFKPDVTVSSGPPAAHPKPGHKGY